MLHRLLNAGAALVGGALVAADHLLARDPKPPPPPSDDDLPPAACKARATLDHHLAGFCPVCELPVDANAGPHVHEDDELAVGGYVPGTACVVWPTEHDGAVLVTDPDGSNGAVWAS